ncbi:MAG: hypothetical protein LBK99_16045 [Opitutaceae bacterium]|nr:hypothetical protein [Opitutaceae bacterium]
MTLFEEREEKQTGYARGSHGTEGEREADEGLSDIEGTVEEGDLYILDRSYAGGSSSGGIPAAATTRSVAGLIGKEAQRQEYRRSGFGSGFALLQILDLP